MEYMSARLLRYPVRSIYLTYLLSASIAVYCPEAELFGGRCDGKFVVRLGKA
jgi:hypothetical protein